MRFIISNQKESFLMGETVELRGYMNYEEFGGKKLPYIYEFFNEDKLVLIMNSDKKRKYAVSTNDCERDNLGNDIAAKMVAEVGNFIIYIKHNEFNEDGSLPITVFRILGIEDDHLFVAMVERADTFNHPDYLAPAIEHLAYLKSKPNVPIQLLNKFSYNNSRVIGYGLFKLNNNGQLVLKRHESQYIMNKNSAAIKDENGEDVKEGLYRFFYSRKMEDRHTKFVDGIKVPDELIDYDIDGLNLSNDSVISNVEDSIHYIKTENGRYVAMIQNSGRIKIIMKLGNDIKFIHLSEEELESLVISVVD